MAKLYTTKRNRRVGNLVRKDSVLLNNQAYDFYVDTLTSIACSIFEWHGLPDTVDVVSLERTLLFNQRVLFFEDEVMGMLALPFNDGGGYDVYGYPVKRIAYSGYTQYEFKGSPANSVVCYDNVLKNDTMETVYFYANRLWSKCRTSDINADAQKTPVLLTGEKKTMLTIKNAFQQFNGNMPVIAMNKKFDQSNISALTTGAPFVSPQMEDVIHTIWNDAMTALGVPNITVQKQERMIRDEVLRGSGGTIACRYPRQTARQRACEQIKKIFGIDVTCSFREELVRMESDNNGSIPADSSRDDE